MHEALTQRTLPQARASSSRGRARGAAATASDGTSWRGRPAAAPLLSLRVSIASMLTVGAVHRVCVCPRRGSNADILCRRHRTALVATGAKNSCLRSCNASCNYATYCTRLSGDTLVNFRANGSGQGKDGCERGQDGWLWLRDRIIISNGKASRLLWSPLRESYVN